MGKTSIEWTDHSWNPIVPVDGGWGCTKVSEGCRYCYAEAVNRRFGNKRDYKGDWNFQWRDTKSGPHTVKAPSRFFVCDMTDVFHPDVPDGALYNLWDIFDRYQSHTFQLLTKRPENCPKWWAPLPNVWIGTSVEDQRTADVRIPLLLHIGANVQFLSVEPLLGPIDLPLTGIDWLIVGGESGPQARVCDVAWIRSIIRQCRETDTPCFVKQLGSAAGVTGKGGDMNEWPEDLRVREFPKEVDRG